MTREQRRNVAVRPGAQHHHVERAELRREPGCGRRPAPRRACPARRAAPRRADVDPREPVLPHEPAVAVGRPGAPVRGPAWGTCRSSTQVSTVYRASSGSRFAASHETARSARTAGHREAHRPRAAHSRPSPRTSDTAAAGCTRRRNATTNPGGDRSRAGAPDALAAVEQLVTRIRTAAPGRVLVDRRVRPPPIRRGSCRRRTRPPRPRRPRRNRVAFPSSASSSSRW